MNRSEICQRLELLRQAKFGKEQSYAAFEAASGVSRGSVQAIAQNRSYPRLDILEKWLAACDSSLAKFFGAPSRQDFSLPFDYDPSDSEEYSRLATILNSKDDDLRHGIHVNLVAISEKAERIVSERTATSSARGQPRKRRRA